MQANLIWTHNFFDATTNQVQVVSPGLVVMEGDSCAKVCEFESRTGHRMVIFHIENDSK